MLLLRQATPPAAFSTAPAASCGFPSWPSSSSTAARCSVGSSSAKLSAVLFEPLRSGSDPWAADQQQQDDERNYDELERDRKGIPGIHVPRQRYIAVPKAALLDAVLTQFPSEADAAHFKRCARCLDAILHAEHKGMLEEMRTSYMLTQRHHQEEEEDHDDQKQTDTSNAQASSGFFGITQEDGTLFLARRSLGLRTLLGLTPDPDSQTRYSAWD